MRSHNALATKVNNSLINKLPVRLYNVQLIRFGSPVRRWTSLFCFVFLATHRCVLACGQVFPYSKFTNPKLPNCQLWHEFTGEEEQIVWIKSASCPLDCPKQNLSYFYFWLLSDLEHQTPQWPSPPVTVMEQEEGSVKLDLERKPRAERKNL